MTSKIPKIFFSSFCSSINCLDPFLQTGVKVISLPYLTVKQTGTDENF